MFSQLVYFTQVPREARNFLTYILLGPCDQQTLQYIENRNEVTIKSDMSCRLDRWFEMVLRHVEINCICVYILPLF
jgi:hypothetical protein